LREAKGCKVGLGEFLLRVFQQKGFSRIVLKHEVAEDIINFAKSNSPREFIAILEGKVTGDSLVISGLLYQPFNASKNFSLVKLNLPMLTNSVGSVHSHPSANTSPSKADLRFFSKNGFVHMIIGTPFSTETIACYNPAGEMLEFTIE
jgi:proteasome lid subunit RPN8/RPN11